MDHPHACGDKLLLDLVAITFRGSSPRVWGQDDNNGKLTVANRIIPTRVGTRNVRITSEFRRKDHPHACGDKLKPISTNFVPPGSSPRVWGQVTRYLHMLKDSRIIPTRVGTSGR